ncbi:hypothetical protein BD777DRAFT_124450 [Yarrowia lipolytica]|jgi:hypothetical protein|nr:hypothetical protein BD777DRAFT_124450 [Yarrowia lipolytica]
MVKCGEGDFCVTHTLSGHMFSVSRALLKLTDPAKASYRSVNVSLSTDQSFSTAVRFVQSWIDPDIDRP